MMKLELKTENGNRLNSFLPIFRIFCNLTLIIIFCNIALKLGIISRHYQIVHNCKLLSADKSNQIFKKLSNLTDLKTKQKIWEYCR